MEQNATSYQSQGLVRALGLLKMLGRNERALTLIEISAELQLPKSTVLRLLSVLESEGFVYREGTPPSYIIGHAVLELSAAYRRQADAAQVAEPYLHQLAARTGLTANIGRLEGRSVLHICVEEPDRPLRFRSGAGSLDHTYCTGLGKLLLANLVPARRDHHLPDEPYETFTNHTIATRRQLITELDHISERGYSVDEQERDKGVVCIAVSIPLAGDLNVALSVSGAAGELSENNRPGIVSVLRQVAGDLAADDRFAASLNASIPLTARK